MPTEESVAQHTPAPWTCDVVIDGRSDFASQQIQPQYVINRSGVGSPVISRREASANADLIAAAPELLAVLRTTALNIRSLGPAGGLSPKYPKWLAVVDAAIAKAEGQS